MGVIYRTQDFRFPDLHRYEPEYNSDGTEKHILCHGARFHVVSWDRQGAKCSELGCEINKQSSNDGLERLFEVCDGGYLKGPGIDALLETPQAQRQLAATEKLRRSND